MSAALRAAALPRRGTAQRQRRTQAEPNGAEVATLKGFGAFIARGNVLDLAVAVVIGAAFTAVVNALVKDLITPLIAALVGKPDFSAIGFTLNNSRFPVGDFINAIVMFVIVALVIYYFVVVPFSSVSSRLGPAATKMAACPECLSDVPAAARRCRYCTAQLTPSA
ncbi:MAG: large conductance mechanosensitive channel protein MscL [Candidatus Elarobacter sp.]